MKTLLASHILLVSAIIASPAAGAPLHAQEAGNAASKECQQAATVLRAFDEAVVRSGGRAHEGDGKLKERELAAQQLAQCGPFGGMTAAWTIRTTRTLSDTAVLRSLLAVFGNVRDTAEVAAAMSVAGDPAASVPARIYALRAIWVLHKGNTTPGLSTISCCPGRSSEASGLRRATSACMWSMDIRPGRKALRPRQDSSQI